MANRKNRLTDPNSLFDVGCLYNYLDAAILSDALPYIAYEKLNFPDTFNLPVKVHHFFV